MLGNRPGSARLVALVLLVPLLLAGCETFRLEAPSHDLDVQAKIDLTPLTPLETLGANLFFDKISDPSWVACANCHGADVGWTGPNAGVNLHGAVYPGAVPQRFGNRKPASAAYASFSPIFYFDDVEGIFVGGNFWDGRATGERLGNPAADQALGPFLSPVEQNMPSVQDVCEAVADAKYADLFDAVWGPGALDCTDGGADAVYDQIGLSIAAFEGSSVVSSFSSKFDAYWDACGGAGNDAEACGLGDGSKETLDPDAIFTAQEFDGLVAFGTYCASCHVSHVEGSDGTHPLFTDFTFDNIGVPKNPENPFYDMDEVFLDDGTPINPLGDAYVDRGLGAYLRSRPEYAAYADENDGKFKVPTLRNVDQRPGNGFPKAYMHNGVFTSLEEVVHFYNTRDVAGAGWPEPEVDRNVNHELLGGAPLGNLELDAETEAAIVAFMETLSDGYR